MTGPDGGDDARRIFDYHVEFADGTSVHAVAWRVPATDAYPDGVHYRFHYGSPAGTVVRYDNAHGGRHERHGPDGTVENVYFPAYWRSTADFCERSPGSARRTTDD